MNNGFRFISQNRSQDLPDSFPLVKNTKSPFKQNENVINSDTIAEQEIKQSIIKSSFIANVLGVIGFLFGIIFGILRIQGQNSILQEYIFDSQTFKISLTSWFFGFILIIVVITIFIYQVRIKKTLNHDIMGIILQMLFIISFLVSAVTLSYFLIFYFENGYYIVLSCTLCLFINNVVLAIYARYKKQDYQPLEYIICIIIFHCLFIFLSILWFVDIWWTLLICGILIMAFEILTILSANFILKKLNLNLTEKDYIIAVPIIFCINIVTVLALIILRILKSQNSKYDLFDDDDF